MVYGNHIDKSKRQQRVSHLVRTELAQILRRGFPLIQSASPSSSGVPEELRRRISIVDVDISPDLRQARITISIIGNKDEVIEKRRVYSWLVSNTRSIRHALAKRMDHLKVLPNLTFVLADVAAAVDVMELIDRVSSGEHKREGVFSAEDYYSFSDEDEEGFLDFMDDGGDDDDWIDGDDEEEWDDFDEDE
jgi:ribosome-binding factor A